MNLSTTDLVLAPDDAIDLQLHTTYSDGRWTPEQLIGHLLRDHFRLAAITDHDRVDTAAFADFGWRSKKGCRCWSPPKCHPR